MDDHAHAWEKVGYCSHPHSYGADTHRTYRCACDAYAHSRQPVALACGPRRRQPVAPPRCPVGADAAGVAEWEAWSREYEAARERAAATARREARP